MLNSFELTDLLLARNFNVKNLKRTKAREFSRTDLPYPIFVKIGGKKDQLKAIATNPLVIHPEDYHRLRENRRIPNGIHLSGERTKSTGYNNFPIADPDINSNTRYGFDLSVSGENALDELIKLLSSSPTRGSIVDPDENLLLKAASLEIAADPECKNIAETERQSLIKARIGQGYFRQRMLCLWKGRCAVTGCSIESVLVASHAKPWSESDNRERLDEFNGFLLAASVDKLFDQGLISFNDEGEMLVSPSLPFDQISTLGLRKDSKLSWIDSRHKPYLSAHRKRNGFSYN